MPRDIGRITLFQNWICFRFGMLRLARYRFPNDSTIPTESKYLNRSNRSRPDARTNASIDCRSYRRQ